MALRRLNLEVDEAERAIYVVCECCGNREPVYQERVSRLVATARWIVGRLRLNVH